MDSDRNGISIGAITGVEDLPGIEPEWRSLHEQNTSLSFFSSYDFISNSCRLLLSSSDSIFIVTFRAQGKLIAVIPLCFTLKRRAGISYVAVELIGCREGDRPGISSIVNPQELWPPLRCFLERQDRPWHVLQLAEMGQGNVQESMQPWMEDSRYTCFLERDRVSYSVSLQGTFDDYLLSRPAGVQRLYRRHMRATERKFGVPALRVYSGDSVMDEGLPRYCEIERKSRKFALGITLSSNPKRLEFYRALSRDLSQAKSARIFIWTAGGKDLAGAFVFSHGKQVYEREIVFNQEYQAISPGVLVQVEMYKYHFGLGLDEFDLLGMHPSHGEPQHKIDWATAKRDTFRFLAVVNRSRLFPWVLLETLRRKEKICSSWQREAA